jgi:cob(I)alamin adenosyltransferase
MKIYTKFGDQGQTRLVGGECVQKNNPRVECYGTVDELNSSLGLVVAHWTALEKTTDKMARPMAGTPALSILADLTRIQNELFNLGSLLACEKKETLPLLPAVSEAHILKLESQIDAMTSQLAPLKNFILPGGSLAASSLHLSRTICRRAERATVGLIDELKDQLSTEEADSLKTCLRYLNRLSDYLFVAARFANFSVGIPDQVWQK